MLRGTRVVIHGLVSAPELNGSFGTIASPVYEGRYSVRVEERAVRIKPSNVHPVDVMCFLRLQKRYWQQIHAYTKGLYHNNKSVDQSEVAYHVGDHMRLDADGRLFITTSDGHGVAKLERCEPPFKDDVSILQGTIDSVCGEVDSKYICFVDAKGNASYFVNRHVIEYLDRMHVTRLACDMLLWNSIKCNMTDAAMMCEKRTRPTRTILYCAEESFVVLVEDDAPRRRVVSLEWEAAAFYVARNTPATMHKLAFLSGGLEITKMPSSTRPIFVPGAVLEGSKERIVSATDTMLMLSNGRCVKTATACIDPLSFLHTQTMHISHFVEIREHGVVACDARMNALRQLIVHIFFFVRDRPSLGGEQLQQIMEQNMPFESEAYFATIDTFAAAAKTTRGMNAILTLAESVVCLYELVDQGAVLKTRDDYVFIDEPLHRIIPSIAVDPIAALGFVLQREYTRASQRGVAPVHAIPTSATKKTTKHSQKPTLEKTNLNEKGVQTNDEWGKITRKLAKTEAQRLELAQRCDRACSKLSASDKRVEHVGYRLGDAEARVAHAERVLEAERNARIADEAAWQRERKELSDAIERLQTQLVGVETACTNKVASLQNLMAKEVATSKNLRVRLDEAQECLCRVRNETLELITQQVRYYATSPHLCIETNKLNMRLIETYPAARNLVRIFSCVDDRNLLRTAVETCEDIVMEGSEHIRIV